MPHFELLRAHIHACAAAAQLCIFALDVPSCMYTSATGALACVHVTQCYFDVLKTLRGFALDPWVALDAGFFLGGALGARTLCHRPLLSLLIVQNLLHFMENSHELILRRLRDIRDRLL